MDNFNVPKKVNRHVLKALNILSGGNFKEGITAARICQQVKYQMRNLVPVPSLDRVIKKSLKNLSLIGLIERKDQLHYCIGKNYTPPKQTQPNNPDRKLFRVINERQNSRSVLDPNLKRRSTTYSEESLSGDEFDRTRKRLRSNNKQPKHTGRSTFLPRARQYKCPQNMFRLNRQSAFNSFVSNSSSEESNFGNNDCRLKFPTASIPLRPSLEITEILEEPERSVQSTNTVEIRTSEVGPYTEDSKLDLREDSVMQQTTPQTSASSIGKEESPRGSEVATRSEVVKKPSVPQVNESQPSDPTMSYIN